MISEPLISICIITYNHQNFILDALRSVAEQKVSFDFEIVIGDDSSEDQNQKIIKNFVEENPNLNIQAILRKKNIGMLPNFLDTLSNCKSKYIALLEGDDYWTDPLKLQKQVDYLETNPNVNFCCHNFARVKDSGHTEFFFDAADKLIPFEEWLSAPIRIAHTASYVFRNNFELPTDFGNFIYGDFLLSCIVSKEQPIYYFGSTMCIYRMHQGGFTNRPFDYNLFTKLKGIFNYIDEYFNFRYTIELSKGLKGRYSSYIDYQLKNKDHLDDRLKFWLNLVKSNFTNKYLTFRDLIWILRRKVLKNHQ